MSALSVLQASQLGFKSPRGSGLINYNISEQANITWTTPYQYTTVSVWQGPFDNGAYAMSIIVANATQSQNSVLWNASSLSGSDLSAPFAFRLQKGDTPNNCELCVKNSVAFSVSNPTASSSTSSSTSTTSSSATTTSSSLSDSPTTVGIGLGVGLGVGLGLILLFVVLGLMLLKRRGKRREAQERRAEALNRAPTPEVRRSIASSGKTASSLSYHSQFEFETPNGSIREGWERLFGPDGQVVYHRMPARPGKAVVRWGLP